jgi:hypothetical protein
VAPRRFVWVPLGRSMDRAKPVSTRGASVRTTATTLGGDPEAREQQPEILCLAYRAERGQTIREYFRAGGKRTMRSRTVVHNLVPTALRGQPVRIQQKVGAHAPLAGDRAVPHREFGVKGPMSCQELVKLARDYLKEALAPVERGALLAGSGPEPATADRKAEPIRS